MQSIELVSHEHVVKRVKEIKNRGIDYKSKVGPTLKKLWDSDRELLEVNDTSRIDTLYSKFPNFTDTLNIYRPYIIRSQKLPRPFVVKPVLLLGPPGIGKTYFVSELAKSLGLPFFRLSMNNISGNFALAGGSLQWGDADVGFVAKSLADSTCANPIILLDEMDKVTNLSGNQNPIGPLLSLLESHSARQFKDEALELILDASHINWIATANYIEDISEPVISRFHVIEIGELNPEDMLQILNNVYKNLLFENGYETVLNPQLDDSVLDKLVACIPREASRLLSFAATRAINEDRNFIICEDITLFKSAKEPNRVGFI
ncbi:MAG: AAA family ATPase [Methylotenera sp.]|nr:AAA family ATPase [Methylotenera sp.]